MNNEQLVSYCGFYCGTCPKYLSGRFFRMCRRVPKMQSTAVLHGTSIFYLRGLPRIRDGSQLSKIQSAGCPVG